MTFAVATDRLSRTFHGVAALAGLDLEVPQGIIFGFLGPNGAGKTTTIRLLLGLLEPTGGAASVLGLDVRRHAPEVRSKVGVLLESDGLYQRLSVYDNLDLFGEILHMPTRARRQRIEELLRHFQLWERRNERAGALSKGTRQKVAILRALLGRPALVFLDEPTSGLDPVSAAALRADIVALASREGSTIFLTTHNLAEAEKICQRVGVIRKGRLIASDAPRRLRMQAVQPRLKIVGRGFSEGAAALVRALPPVRHVSMAGREMVIEFREATDTAPIVALLVQAGVEVEEARKGGASLEQVFISLMEEEER